MPAAKLPTYHGFLKRIRILGPTMVFVATFILMTVSVIGTVVAFSIYRMQESNASVVINQTLTLLSSAASFLFIGLYLLAARRNEPVSKTRPPTLPLHGACFIFLRITTLLWAAAMLVGLGTVFNLASCQDGTGICLLHRIDMVVSIIAILTTIIILFGLETCDEPFRTPTALRIRPRIVCRVSYFEDILERSVSRRSSLDNGVVRGQESCFRADASRVTQIKKTFIPVTVRPIPENFSSASTLLEKLEQRDKNPFHSPQAYPAHKPGYIGRSSKYSQSDYRLLSKSSGSITQKLMSSQSQQSSGSPFESSTSDARGLSSRPSNRSRASPTSSISSYSRRSPLSTMRTVENPDMPIDTDVQLCLARRDCSQQESSALHTVDRSAVPMATAHMRSWRRRAPARAGTVDLRRQTIQSKNVKAGMSGSKAEVPGHNPTMSKDSVVGKTLLGAGSKENAQKSVESALEVHSRIIEGSIKLAVKRRMQQGQKHCERFIQDEVVAEESRNLVRLQIQEDEDRSSRSSVSKVELSSEDSTVLP